jgi:hypothetical protein
VKSTGSPFLSRGEIVHEDGDDPAAQSRRHTPIVNDAVLSQNVDIDYMLRGQKGDVDTTLIPPGARG